MRELVRVAEEVRYGFVRDGGVPGGGGGGERVDHALLRPHLSLHFSYLVLCPAVCQTIATSASVVCPKMRINNQVRNELINTSKKK